MRTDLIENVVSVIKRVNERRTEIMRRVKAGKIPEGILKNWDAAFQIIAQNAGLNLTKSGNLPHGKRAVEDLDTDALQGLLQRKTAGEIKKDIKRGAKMEYGEEPTPEELEEYQDDMSYVYDELSENPSETYDAFDSKFRGVPGRKSYHQLKQAIEEWKGYNTQQKEVALENAVNRMFN